MSSDLFHTPEHAMFRETVRKFVDEELRPRARGFEMPGWIRRSELDWYETIADRED